MTTRTSLVSGVDFVCVATSDSTATMDFYGNVLGLPRSSVWRFLDEHVATAPRILLRYAIEHLDQGERRHYMAMKGALEAPATGRAADG